MLIGISFGERGLNQMKTLKEIKIKELVFNNIGLKILAIVVAVILWVIVVNIDDPLQRITISNIPVVLLNEEELTDKDYTYEVESGGTVSIVVRGPQTIIEALKSSDFSAYADLSERTPQSNKAKIVVSCGNESVLDQIDIVSQTTEYVELDIDNKISKDFDLAITLTGEPATGYVVQDYSTSPTTVNVAGAQSTVEQISYAEINYDISDLTADVSDTIAPTFYDKDGNIVESGKLELNWNTAKLYVEILPTKTISVNFAITGDPEEGYSYTDYESNIDSVTIAGTKDELAEINSIDIPGGVIDISGINKTTIFTIPLSTYLSDKYTIVNSESDLIVTTNVEEIIQKKLELPYENISTTGIAEGYEIAYRDVEDEDVLEIEVNALESVVDGLTVDDLAASINLEGKTGVQRIKIDFEENDQYNIDESYYIWVVITEIPEETIETDEEVDTEEPLEINTDE